MLELVLTRPDERRTLVDAAQGPAVPGPRRAAHLPRPPGRRRRHAGAPGARRVPVAGPAVRRHVGHDGQRGHRRRPAPRWSPRSRPGCSAPRSRPSGSSARPSTAPRLGDPDDVAQSDRDDVQAGGAAGDYERLCADRRWRRWVETTFGLATETGHGPGASGSARPRVPDAAARLADLHRRARWIECAQAIRTTLLAGSRGYGTRSPAGRCSPSGCTSSCPRATPSMSSLEPEARRHITAQYQVAVPDQPDKRPAAAGASAGSAARSTWWSPGHADGRTVTYRATPRPRRQRGRQVNGYLYISTDQPWPADPLAEGRLPDSLAGPTTARSPSVAAQVPARRRSASTPTAPRSTAARHRRRVRSHPVRVLPALRVSYEQVRGSDFAKLATLDAEGRSSAVSVVSTSIVRAPATRVPTASSAHEARKLLTFVDNRQDASLQAGHFNDFVQVTQLRGARQPGRRSAAPTA